MATFTHKAVAKVSPDQVWRNLQRADSWGRIAGLTKVDSATFDDTGDLTGYRFSAPVAGTEYAGIATRSMHVPGRRMVMDVKSAQLDGSIAIDLDDMGFETVVTVRLSMEPKGFVTTMLFPAIAASVASEFNETVEKFVSSLED
jgi:hypothetical protein